MAFDGIEWLEIGSVEFNTDAAYFTDLSAFYMSAARRGGDRKVAYREGVRGKRRRVDVTRKNVPIEISGLIDLDGNPTADVRLTLRATVDRLNQLFRPRARGDGTVDLRYHCIDGTIRGADVHIEDWGVSLTKGADLAKGFVELSIPSGVLYDETAVVETWTTSGTKTTINPGSAEQFASVITMAGAQKISNTTFGTEMFVDYTGTRPVSIDTGERTANYTDGALESAMSEVVINKNRFVLLPGSNSLELTTGADVTLTHYPPYL